MFLNSLLTGRFSGQSVKTEAAGDTERRAGITTREDHEPGRVTSRCQPEDEAHPRHSEDEEDEGTAGLAPEEREGWQKVQKGLVLPGLFIRYILLIQQVRYAVGEYLRGP